MKSQDSSWNLESAPRISRRNLLKAGGLAALGLSLALEETLTAGEPAASKPPAAKPAKTASILFFTKSSGFEHPVIKKPGDAPSHAGGVLAKLGKENGFEIHEIKDGRVFDSKAFDDFDAFFFYTSADLTIAGDDKQPPMSEKGKKRLIEAIAGGKGFLGFHSATDSFHSAGEREKKQDKVDPYIAMIGGEFITHGRQQKATMRVTSPKFPGCEKLGDSFALLDEWYTLKNFAKDIHVILVNETKGMEDWMYNRPPFPATWARHHGKGRVYYTSMAHREDVWTNPLFQQIVLSGTAWVLGRAEADVAPNIDKETPRADELPKEK